MTVMDAQLGIHICLYSNCPFTARPSLSAHIIHPSPAACAVMGNLSIKEKQTNQKPTNLFIAETGHLCFLQYSQMSMAVCQKDQ